jgi:ribosomal protein S13
MDLPIARQIVEQIADHPVEMDHISEPQRVMDEDILLEIQLLDPTRMNIEQVANTQFYHGMGLPCRGQSKPTQSPCIT